VNHTIRLSPKSGEFRPFEGLIKTSGSWGSGRKAVKLRRPSRSAPGLSRKELDGMGCGCRRDEGQGEKTEVARGGWAEDARRPPATSFVSVVIPLLIECVVLSEISDRKSQSIDWDEFVWNFALKDKNERR